MINPIYLLSLEVDGERPTNEEFLENLHTASHSLQENLPKIIEYCMGKKLGEL